MARGRPQKNREMENEEWVWCWVLVTRESRRCPFGIRATALEEVQVVKDPVPYSLSAGIAGTRKTSQISPQCEYVLSIISK
jgi:hypothetical protein